VSQPYFARMPRKPRPRPNHERNPETDQVHQKSDLFRVRTCSAVRSWAQSLAQTRDPSTREHAAIFHFPAGLQKAGFAQRVRSAVDAVPMQTRQTSGEFSERASSRKAFAKDGRSQESWQASSQPCVMKYF
jgi:hypothetical protein